MSELSQDTLPSECTGDSDRDPGVPCLTLACHPDPERVGARLRLTSLLVGKAQAVSRRDGLFAHPGRTPAPLADPFVSRTPFHLRPGTTRGQVQLDDPTGRVVVDGQRDARQQHLFEPEQLEQGVVLRVGSRSVMLLHMRRDAADRAYPALLGDSDAVRRLRQDVALAARHEDPVLVRGETGAGKELVARGVHELGARAEGPWVAVNMATLSDATATSALFGHLRGAFTGADRRHRGLFEQASGGTLFLDEVGDTPASVQPMLLRTMETGKLTPMGGERAIKVDVRIVAATDHPIEASGEGFRQPLFHRLAGQTLRVPSLWERRDDIGLLFVHFMQAYLIEIGASPVSNSAEGPPPWMHAEDMERLMLTPLSGNVRELRNLARAAARTWSEGELPRVRTSAPAPVPSTAPREPTTPPPSTLPPAPTVPREASAPIADGADEDALMAALEQHDFVPERAARALGIASSTMHYFMLRSPHIRRATDISDAELLAALQAAGGDKTVAARALKVSRRALGMALKQRGIRA